jgi:SAM-dependent methyltransferase
VYERQAGAFDAQRSRTLVERVWLERFAAAISAGGTVLDLGCGGGEPVGRWLIDNGFAVTGIDFAEPMLAIARQRWPAGDWRCHDMRHLELDETFAGVVAWDSLFHLTPDEQEECLPRVCSHVEQGGALLASVGPRRAEVDGRVGPEPVYHGSLSPARYSDLLERSGLRLVRFVAEDPDCGNRSVLLARRDLHGCR